MWGWVGVGVGGIRKGNTLFENVIWMMGYFSWKLIYHVAWDVSNISDVLSSPWHNYLVSYNIYKQFRSFDFKRCNSLWITLMFFRHDGHIRLHLSWNLKINLSGSFWTTCIQNVRFDLLLPAAVYIESPLFFNEICLHAPSIGVQISWKSVQSC